MELKVKLKEVLIERGMSQVELAEKTGLTRTVIVTTSPKFYKHLKLQI